MNDVIIKLPRSWEELTEKKLKFIYRLIASGLSVVEMRIAAALRFSGLKVRGYLLLEHKGNIYKFAKDEIYALGMELSYLHDLPSRPVRPKIIGHRRLSPMLNEIDFETFLILDNHLQGYIQTDDPDHLMEMSNIMYPVKSIYKIPERLKNLLRRRVEKRVPSVMEIATLFWFSTVKCCLSRLYPFFLHETRNGDSISKVEMPRLTPLVASQAEAVDTQLRALTKGDITKERAVRAMPYRRALTELNALAREAEEQRRMLKK